MGKKLKYSDLTPKERENCDLLDSSLARTNKFLLEAEDKPWSGLHSGRIVFNGVLGSSKMGAAQKYLKALMQKYDCKKIDIDTFTDSPYGLQMAYVGMDD